jgi:hypothetical protein
MEAVCTCHPEGMPGQVQAAESDFSLLQQASMP